MVAYSHHDKIPLWWEYVRILSKKQICAGVTKARLIVTIKMLTTLNIVRGMMMMLTMLLMMVMMRRKRRRLIMIDKYLFETLGLQRKCRVHKDYMITPYIMDNWFIF